MLKIKKKRANYRSIKICSDLHYGHNKDFLYEPRGFMSAEEHNDWIASQIQSLHPEDLLICLGDVGLSIGPDPIIKFVESFPCETLMVWGNHNSGVVQLYKNAIDSHRRRGLLAGFEEAYPLQISEKVTMVGDCFLLDIDRDRFYCTHMSPLIFPDQGKGRVCLCGHSHGNLQGINPGRDDYGKILDCGVENAKAHNGTAFFDLEEVVSVLSKKLPSTLDHH